MNEFIGLAYYAEVPAVIFDVQRAGPSTGMPTRTQQGDLMLCAYASHGDTRHICLYPADPREAFEMATQRLRSRRAFPDAGLRAERSRHRHERLDGPEADLGRQLPARSRQGAVGGGARAGEGLLPLPRRRRRRHPVSHAAGRAPQGRVLHARIRATTATAPTRRMPTSTSTCSIASIARSSAPRAFVPAPIVRTTPGAKLGLLTIGGCHAACTEALDILAREGIAVDYMRVRGFPFGDEVAGVPRRARRHLRRRAESRRAAAQPADARDGRRPGEAGVGALLRRVPDERAPRDFRREGQVGEGGMTYITKPAPHHPALQKNALGLTQARLRGRDHDALRRLRARFDHRRHHPGVLGPVDLSIQGGEAVGHRLLVEDAGVLPARGARPQRRARPHARARHRRERGQPRPHLHRHLRRRRFAVDRPRPVVPRDPPQRERPLRAREQRRLRPDQGAVLGVGRSRLAQQEGRGEHDGRDRRLPAGADARRDVRRAQLLRRQGPARADPQGRASRTTASRSSTSSRRA